MESKISETASRLILVLTICTGTLFCPNVEAQAAQCLNFYKTGNGLSSIFYKSGFKYFSHQTDARSLIGILRHRAILSRRILNAQKYKVRGNHVPGMNRDVVYVTALKRNPLKNRFYLRQLMNDEVLMFFKPQVIEKNPVLFINDGWLMGKNNPEITLPANNLTRSRLRNLTDSNEVILARLGFDFHDVKIVVLSQAYNRLKSRLESEVSAEIKWEEILIPFEMNFDD